MANQSPQSPLATDDYVKIFYTVHVPRAQVNQAIDDITHFHHQHLSRPGYLFGSIDTLRSEVTGQTPDTQSEPTPADIVESRINQDAPISVARPSSTTHADDGAVVRSTNVAPAAPLLARSAGSRRQLAARAYDNPAFRAVDLLSLPVQHLHGTRLRSDDGFVPPKAVIRNHPGTASGQMMAFVCQFVLPSRPWKREHITSDIRTGPETTLPIRVSRDSSLGKEWDQGPPEALWLIKNVSRAMIGHYASCLKFDKTSTAIRLPTNEGCSLERVFEFNAAMDREYLSRVGPLGGSPRPVS